MKLASGSPSNSERFDYTGYTQSECNLIQNRGTTFSTIAMGSYTDASDNRQMLLLKIYVNANDVLEMFSLNQSFKPRAFAFSSSYSF